MQSTNSTPAANKFINNLGQWFVREKMTEFHVEMYLSVLEGYPDKVINMAFSRLTEEWTKQSRPQPAEIKALCDKVAGNSGLVSQSTGEQRLPGHDKHTKAIKMAKDYEVNFHCDRLHVEAQQQGWGQRLRDFVYAAGHYQAQIICGCRNMGISKHVLGLHEWFNEEEFAQFKHNLSQNAKEKGRINFEIPQAALNHWRGHTSSTKEASYINPQYQSKSFNKLSMFTQKAIQEAVQ